jgi:hypothetical protein
MPTNKVLTAKTPGHRESPEDLLLCAHGSHGVPVLGLFNTGKKINPESAEGAENAENQPHQLSASQRLCGLTDAWSEVEPR